MESVGEDDTTARAGPPALAEVVASRYHSPRSGGSPGGGVDCSESKQPLAALPQVDVFATFAQRSVRHLRSSDGARAQPRHDAAPAKDAAVGAPAVVYVPTLTKSRPTGKRRGHHRPHAHHARRAGVVPKKPSLMSPASSASTVPSSAGATRGPRTSLMDTWARVLRSTSETRRRARLYILVTWLSNTTVVLALVSMVLVLLEFEQTYAASVSGTVFFQVGAADGVQNNNNFTNPLPDLVDPGNTPADVESVDLAYPSTPASDGLAWGYFVLSVVLALTNIGFHFALFELLDRRDRKTVVNTVVLCVLETALCLAIVPPPLARVNIRYFAVDASDPLSPRVAFVWLSNEINSLAYFRIYFVFRFLRNSYFMPPRSICYEDIRTLLHRIQGASDQLVIPRYLGFLEARYSPFSLAFSIRWLMKRKPMQFSVWVIALAYIPLAFFLVPLERVDPRAEFSDAWTSFYFVMETMATVGFGDLWVYNPFSRAIVVIGCIFVALGIVACISAVLINVVKLSDAQQTVAFHVQVTAWQKEYKKVCAVVIQRAWRLYGGRVLPPKHSLEGSRENSMRGRSLRHPRSVRGNEAAELRRVVERQSVLRFERISELRNAVVHRKVTLHTRPVATVSTSARQRAQLLRFKQLQQQFEKARKAQHSIELLGMQVEASTRNLSYFAARIGARERRVRRRATGEPRVSSSRSDSSDCSDSRDRSNSSDRSDSSDAEHTNTSGPDAPAMVTTMYARG